MIAEMAFPIQSTSLIASFIGRDFPGCLAVNINCHFYRTVHYRKSVPNCNKFLRGLRGKILTVIFEGFQGTLQWAPNAPERHEPLR